MAEAGYVTLAVKTPVGERLKEYRRKMAATLDRDLTFTDVLTELLDSYAEQHDEVKVA